MPKFLVSSTITDPDWNNTTRLEGDVVEAVRKLKDEFDGVIQVPGSRQLVHDLVENDLVDQINLMIFPVVLGTGKRVFGETSDKKTMKLVESKTVGDGIVILVYERTELATAPWPSTWSSTSRTPRSTRGVRGCDQRRAREHRRRDVRSGQRDASRAPHPACSTPRPRSTRLAISQVGVTASARSSWSRSRTGRACWPT